MAFSALWLQNVDYPARIDRAVFDNIWTEGVLGSGSLQVIPSVPAGMSVQVTAGSAVVQGDNQVFQGKYLCREQTQTSGIVISAAPGSGTRHDLVVLQVRDPNATGPSGDDAIISVVAGTASSSPVDPAVPPSALVLARIRVAAGTGSITAGLIDDLRVEAKDAYNTLQPASVGLNELSSAVSGFLVPTGTITQFAGTTAPAGWLLCDGTAYASATYPALSSIVGSLYNTSGGQSSPPAGQFRVPLLTGRIPVGRSTGETEFDTLGKTGGDKSVTLTSAQSGLVAHGHTVTASGTSGLVSSDHTHTWGGSYGTTGQDVDHFHSGTTASDGSHSHTIDITGANVSNHTHFATTSGSAAGASSPVAGSGAVSGIVNSGGGHTHFFNSNGTSNSHAHSVTVGGNTGGISANHSHSLSVSGSAANNAAANATQAHTNIQPYITVNYIIKT